MKQTFYPQEANELHPEGCKCPTMDAGGDCDWCKIYYHGPTCRQMEAKMHGLGLPCTYRGEFDCTRSAIGVCSYCGKQLCRTCFNKHLDD